MSESTVEAPAPKKPQLSMAQLKAQFDDLAEVNDANAAVLEANQTTMLEMDRKLAEALTAINSLAAAITAGQKASTLPIGARSPAGIDAQRLAETTGMLDDGGDPNAPMVERVRLMDVDSPEFREKAQIEAFMEEMVEVQIHTTSDKDADQVFEIAVNGRRCMFHRGQKKRVKRYFVFGLATARPNHYDNQAYTMNNGARAYRYPVRSGLRYPFNMTRDENPIGEAWLERILAAPQ